MRRFAALLMMVVAPVVAPQAAQHPDLSGKWTFDAAQSGAELAQVTGSITVTQSTSTIKLEQNLSSPQTGPQSATLTIPLDGSQGHNTVSGGGMSLDLASTAAWEGSTLVVTSTADVQGNALKTVEHWALDESGKVLSLTSDVSIGGQAMSRKQVFKIA